MSKGVPSRIRASYQDVLRALGHYIDQHGFREIRLIETEDGLILQGLTPGEGAGQISTRETYLLTLQDLEALLLDAYKRRGTKI